MLPVGHVAALQAWAQTIEYGGTVLYVDGVPCHDLLALAETASPEQFSSRVRERVVATRYARTKVS